MLNILFQTTASGFQLKNQRGISAMTQQPPKGRKSAPQPHRGGEPQPISNISLVSSAKDLRKLAQLLAAFSAVLPARTTVRSAAAFAAVAFSSSMGGSMTLSDLIERVGEDAQGQPLFGNAPDRVLDTFRMPTNKVPDSLAWVDTEEDPDDRRRKYLILTDDGKEAAKALAGVLGA